MLECAGSAARVCRASSFVFQLVGYPLAGSYGLDNIALCVALSVELTVLQYLLRCQWSCDSIALCGASSVEL